MEAKLDKKDKKILQLYQENCKMPIKEVAKGAGCSIMTVYSKIKRLETLGVIKGYKAILDASILNKGTTAFVLVSFGTNTKSTGKVLSLRELAKKIATILKVQEVHILAGEWDLLLKIKVKDVNEVGNIVLDRLLLLEGVQKAMTMLAYDTPRETSDITID